MDMRIKTAISYNLDLLCFLNSMTGNKFIAEYHKEAYEKFYPLVSDGIKHSMKRMLRLNVSHLLAPGAVTALSSVHDFDKRELSSMLGNQVEMKQSISKTKYGKSPFMRFMLRRLINKYAIPLVKELENAGFKEFWHSERLPLLQERCNGLDEYMEQHSKDAEKLFNRFIKMDTSDFIIYVCSFANPQGIKLCGNNMIVDYVYDNKTILEILTHEPFHPPYDFKTVRKSVKALAKKPWVKEAYKKQTPEHRYFPMSMYIEENLVDALGKYVAVQLELDIDPKKELTERDNGSHVISPYFYDYLCENEKDVSQSFEDYFTSFVDSLDT
jgi:hypothetical protein